MRITLGVLALVLVIGGCAGKKAVVPPETLWDEANQAMDDGAYELAVEKYKKLLDQYPFDENAENAELSIARAYYRVGRFPEAISAYGDFERMHPTSPNLAQVEYERGLAHMAQHRSIDREQEAAKNAHAAFQNVLDRFPGTPWAARAELQIRTARHNMAWHDAKIAVFYLDRGSLRAAEARLRGLLTDYPDSDATAWALARFAEEYDERDESQGAALARATLVRHHPEGDLADEARQQLSGDAVGGAGPDPLPELVALLDQSAGTAARQDVPRTISAYPEGPAGGPGAPNQGY
jgi:outer membrane protein assembly factor BamD